MNIYRVAVLTCAVFTASTTMAPVSYAETLEATPTKASQPKAETQVETTLDILLSSIEADDYAAFSLAVGDEMKSVITKEVFEKVVEQISPRLKNGYISTYFGSMKKAGYDVHLWKLEFSDKGDDMLAELSIKEKKVGGFFLR